MGVNSLPKTVTKQLRGRNLNPGLSAPESSTLTTRLPSHPFNCTRARTYLAVQGKDQNVVFVTSTADPVHRGCISLATRLYVYDTIRYDTRCYFNVRSKADTSQLNLPHGTDN